MELLEAFNTDVLVIALAILLALAAFKLTQWVPVPAPALLLIAAAIASDIFPELGINVATVERIGIVALIVILLDGGMHVGWRRFRGSLYPIAMLGVVGTFMTAALIAVAAHTLLDFNWVTSWLLGAALAPTDPAVMFSVLGNREVGGRSGTILEGESGANDPVGIALMIGMIEYATSNQGTAWGIATEVVVEMAVGLVVGVVGGRLLIPLMQRVSLPREGLYPIRVLAVGAAVYGVAAALHGSGFLAVFIVGLLIGDVHAPYKTEIDRFHTALASLAEIAVFVALGLTIFGPSGLWDDLPEGIVLFLFLALVARPIAVALLLWGVRLRTAEKLFVAWGGLKGAVPILLAAFALVGDVPDAPAIYNIVFVVVALSVLVQGSTIPWVAHRLGVPMRVVEPEPWDVSIRLREPGQIQRYTVGPRSRVLGSAIRDLPARRARLGLVRRPGRHGTTGARLARVPRGRRGPRARRPRRRARAAATVRRARRRHRLAAGDDRRHSPGGCDPHDATCVQLRDVRVPTVVDGDPDPARDPRDHGGCPAFGTDAQHAELRVCDVERIARRADDVDRSAEARSEGRDLPGRVDAPQQAVVRVGDHEHAVAAPHDVVRMAEQRLERRPSVACSFRCRRCLRRS